MKIKISDIQIPEVYLRKRKPSHVAYLLDVAKQSSQWPFDPIEVAGNGVSKITKIKPKEGDKKGKTRTIKPWELLDGGHRVAVAVKMGLKDIPAIEKNIKDPGLRFLEQFRANSSHGLKLDVPERNQAIWELVNRFHMKVTTVADATGLHKASVSRIATKKQGWLRGTPEGSKKMVRTHSGKSEETESTTETNEEVAEGAIFSPSQFVDRLVVMVADYKRQPNQIAAAFKEKFGLENNAKAFLQELNRMTKEIYDSM